MLLLRGVCDVIGSFAGRCGNICGGDFEPAFAVKNMELSVTHVRVSGHQIGADLTRLLSVARS